MEGATSKTFWTLSSPSFDPFTNGASKTRDETWTGAIGGANEDVFDDPSSDVEADHGINSDDGESRRFER